MIGLFLRINCLYMVVCYTYVEHSSNQRHSCIQW